MSRLPVYFVFLVIMVMITTPSQSHALTEKRGDCISNQICFVPDDYLNYITYKDAKVNWKESFTFSSFFDSNSIDVNDHNEDPSGPSMIVGGKVASSSDSLVHVNLGGAMEIGCGLNICEALQPSPVDINRWLNHPTSADYWKGKVHESTTMWNNYNRIVIVINDSDTNQVIDKETGVLLSVQTKGAYDTNSHQPVFLTTLSDTNIIKSSNVVSNQITSNTIIPDNTSPIPSWIKNNIKLWSQGQIRDSDFLKGIQYLVQNSVIHISQTNTNANSQHGVPTWVKNNAKWWSEGILSDDDFLKGIQYLVQTGIINTSTQTCNQSLWDHVYHPNRLKVIDNCKTVTGVIDKILKEKDGDFHIRVHLDSQYANLINDANVANQHGDLVVEPICQNTVEQQDAIDSCANFNYKINIPTVGTHIKITGSYVLDLEHGGWAEIHPVTSMEEINP